MSAIVKCEYNISLSIYDFIYVYHTQTDTHTGHTPYLYMYDGLC